jgi:triosephosphate isomerase (TIM)
LKVIACVGETEKEYDENQTKEVISRQLASIEGAIKKWENVVIAYEPVWAIGTGKSATPNQAQEVHLYIRNWLKEKVSEEVSNQTRILYGGSVTSTNCKDLISKEDIDGFLVGTLYLKNRGMFFKGRIFINY